jgi:1-acyl-sn-glycerol-3-phosphate acyltransferase
VLTRTGQPLVNDESADCERHDDWFLGEDVNAWSSLAYLAVGLVIVAVVLRRRLPRAFVGLGAAVAIEGIGSLLYHGGSGDLAQLLHDAPLVGALGFIAGWHAGRLSGRPDATALVGLAVGLLGGTVASAIGWTNIAVGVLVAITVVTEVVARRRRLLAVWTVPVLVLAAVAAAAWLAGTSQSPLCDADSWAQPHGAWHVLSALLLLTWFDRAVAVAAPERAPRVWRTATDRVLGLLTWALAHVFHRTVEVTGRERLPAGRPLLIVANHGNGFVDPIVVAGVLRRLPRFIAKAALWKVLVARPFLGLAGVLPVQRRVDGDGRSDNRSVFEACHRELARGAVVAIFPEGTTGDRARLDRVKSGAARIALGAVPGAPTLAVVPIGMAFESRTETRGRALVMIGEPIDVAERAVHPMADGNEPDHVDVRALTDDITTALEDVSPEFATVEEREVLRGAARVNRDARRRQGVATFGEVEVVARALAARPPATRAGVIDAYRRYATLLQLIGLHDEDLAGRSLSSARVVASAVLLALAGSVVVTATLIHLPALLLVVVTTGAVRSTATKGTVRLLVGLAAGLLTWIIAGAVLADGWAAVAAGVLVALGGALALAVWTPLTRLAAALWAWLRSRDRVGLLPPVLAERDAVVTAVDEAMA